MAKLLVQDEETNHFFKGLKEWTPDGRDALDFVSAEIALRFCKSHNVENVALVRFDEEERRVLDVVHLCSWFVLFCPIVDCLL